MMRIQSLIDELHRIRDVHGDMEVTVYVTDQYGEQRIEVVDTVDVVYAGEPRHGNCVVISL